MNKHIFIAVIVGLMLVIGAYSWTEISHAPTVDLEKEASVGFQGQLSPAEFQKKITEGYIVLDVRTPEEYAVARIANEAVNIDFYADDFRTQLAQLDTNAPYIIHCRSGARSGKTVQIMKDMGFTNFYELTGGINAWEQAGLPVISNTPISDDVPKQAPLPTNIPPKKDTTICTEDVMQCPDGSFVGRTGSECEFVCL